LWYAFGHTVPKPLLSLGSRERNERGTLAIVPLRLFATKKRGSMVDDWRMVSTVKEKKEFVARKRVYQALPFLGKGQRKRVYLYFFSEGGY